MAYNNILNAVANLGGGMSVSDKARNYAVFEELMKKGVDLEKLVKEAESGRGGVDPAVFSAMEEAVKGESDVADARAELERRRDEVLTGLCRGDERFRTLEDEYRRAVSTAYVRRKDEKGARKKDTI